MLLHKQVFQGATFPIIELLIRVPTNASHRLTRLQFTQNQHLSLHHAHKFGAMRNGTILTRIGKLPTSLGPPGHYQEHEMCTWANEGRGPTTVPTYLEMARQMHNHENKADRCDQLERMFRPRSRTALAKQDVDFMG